MKQASQVERWQKRCPFCFAHTIVKNGFIRGSQRFKCKSCSKTFSSQYGKNNTPELKYIALLLMDLDVDCKDVALALGVSRQSISRWKREFVQGTKSWRFEKLDAYMHASYIYLKSTVFLDGTVLTNSDVLGNDNLRNIRSTNIIKKLSESCGINIDEIISLSKSRSPQAQVTSAKVRPSS